MPKKPTKRARAQAANAALVKEVQKAGYTKHTARQLVDTLKKQAGNRSVSADTAAKVAAERKEGFVDQSRLGKTSRGKEYLKRLDQIEEARQALAGINITIPDFIDLAEAAAEGRYHEALRQNKRMADEAIQKAEEAIDELKQELPALTGDAHTEAVNNIKFLEARVERIREIYGSGEAANLKNTSIGRKISKLFD